jgi:hypothetical protein
MFISVNLLRFTLQFIPTVNPLTDVMLLTKPPPPHMGEGFDVQHNE